MRDGPGVREAASSTQLDRCGAGAIKPSHLEG